MGAISAVTAFGWMEKLIAWAVALQTLELLQIRSSFGAEGIWSWQVVRREFSQMPRMMRASLDTLLGDRGFLILLGARLPCALAAVLSPHPLLWGFLLLSTILISVRWRGTFNGGSDYMTLIVLMAVTVSHIWQDHPRVQMGCLWYVALQTCLSFFVAGTVKLKKREWRDGTALRGFLASSYYGAPGTLGTLTRRPGLMRLAAWAALTFECAFPLSLVDPRICAGMIALAALFQLANVYAFGLNRFFWAWAAAYPALYWCSQLSRS
jgi:hypothetical protein